MENRTLTLGHSPDPDDAFMFYGLAKELIPTHGFEFEHILQDIRGIHVLKVPTAAPLQDQWTV